jgi:hypoxanthine phosphoribosyltransferase
MIERTDRKLKQVLNTEGVDNALRKMAREIRMVGYPLAIVAVLKGGAYTAYQLLRILHSLHAVGWVDHKVQVDMTYSQPDVVIGHIGLESYGEEMKSQGEVKLMTPLDLSRNDICDRNVIIVDDCAETGRTLVEAKKIISGYGPLEVYTAVLVDKVALRIENNAEEPDIIGWRYLDKGFLVGAGMGAGEAYRGWPELYEVEE